jgi:hypothetical protein
MSRAERAETVHLLNTHNMHATCGADDATAIRSGVASEVTCRDCLRVGSETTAHEELDAMHAAAAALRPLNRESRRRVLAWLREGVPA